MADFTTIDAGRGEIERAAKAHAVTQARRDKLVRERDGHLRVIAEIEAAAHNSAVEALGLGMSPPEMSREDSRRLANAQRAVKAAPDAIGIGEADLATANTAVERANASFAGEVWNYTLGVQAEARDAFEAELSALGPTLARLAAVDRVRERFASGPLHLANAAAERPWSGRILVKNFVAGIPEKLRGGALNFDAIQREAIRISEQMIARIEGRN